MKHTLISFYSQLVAARDARPKCENLTSITTVGVLMPAFNAASTIERSVCSLQKLGPAIAQIIIVNDGSTDETSAIAHSLAAQDPRITVIDQDNQGAPASRNRAFEELTTEWMTFFDADDIISPHFLERMDVFIGSHSDFDVFMCNTVRMTPSGYMSAYRIMDEPYEVSLEEMFEGSKTVSAAVLLRVEDFAASERFIPEFRVAEDYCLWISMMAEGKRIIVNPEMLFYYCNSPESLISNPVRNVVTTRKVLIYIAEKYKDSLTPVQQVLLRAAVAHKTATLQSIAPVEQLRKLIEPIGGEASNRFFRSMFVAAANLRRTLKDRK